MSITLDAALELIRERAEGDRVFAQVVVHIAEDRVPDPFARPNPAVLDVARSANRHRQAERAQDLRATSLTTAQVVEILGSVSDRKGVDRRRRRGTLLGVRTGRDTLHPGWQFDRRRRDTWPGLPRVLEALATATGDGLAANAIAVAPGATVDGRSIAQLLADGDVDTAVHAALLAGDQS